jgi:hypothetical protein
MVAKLISAWLICLSLMPFTAPFATCDLTIFLAGHAPAPAHGTSETRALADGSLSPALPLLFRASGRIRSIALSECKPAPEVSPHLVTGKPESLLPLSPTTPRHDVTILRI